MRKTISDIMAETGLAHTTVYRLVLKFLIRNEDYASDGWQLLIFPEGYSTIMGIIKSVYFTSRMTAREKKEIKEKALNQKEIRDEKERLLNMEYELRSSIPISKHSKKVISKFTRKVGLSEQAKELIYG